jgi:DNA processing protein
MKIPDPPPVLWVTSNLEVLKRPMSAIVGARNASSLGTRMARYLGKRLGELGFVTVSGLALGIDTAAHLGAVETGTIVVMAGGVDILYPAENANLGRDLTTKGLRISEQPIGIAPKAHHFPSRNRLISGLCSGVIIVEATAKSGSLITARDALDQGREVLVVPGHPFDARAAGCNMLMRDGAVLVRNIDDVVQVLKAQKEPTCPENTAAPLCEAVPPHSDRLPNRDLNQTAKLYQQILSRFNHTPITEDQLMRDVGQGVSTLSSVLVDLELEGRIKRQAGGLLSLA